MKKLVDLVKGKRVCIVGGSPMIIGSNLGEKIDSYDIVVRVNFHWPCPRALLDKEIKNPLIHVGNRTDIFFHAGWFHAGGTIEELSKFSNLKLLVVKNHKKSDYKEIVKWCNSVKITCVPAHISNVITKTKNFYPTTGFWAIRHLLASQINELFICGFDFYKSSSIISQSFSKWHVPNDELEMISRIVYNDNRISLADHVAEYMPKKLFKTIKSRNIKHI